MPVEITVNGPGLQVRRVLGEGQSVLIGRDADCDLCLPDPERTVSRQHLAMWVEAGRLQLRVLSLTNGVDLVSGEIPPGAVAVIGMGQVVMIGDYDITPAEVAPDASFEASSFGIAGRMEDSAFQNSTDEDPFGEWGFDPHTPAAPAVPPTALMPEEPAALSVAVGEAMSGETASFFRGLGLDPSRLAAMSSEELEAAGRKVRLAVQGLVDMYGAKLELNKAMGADERTMVATRENNPLKTDWPLDTKLEYLLGGRSAGAAFAHPLAALADLVAELKVHDAAVTAASRAVLEGALREFEPEKLQARIAGDKSAGLLSKLRPWDAYGKFYAHESGRMAHWLERLFNRYFTPAYTRETTRIKREVPGK